MSASSQATKYPEALNPLLELGTELQIIVNWKEKPTQAECLRLENMLFRAGRALALLGCRGLPLFLDEHHESVRALPGGFIRGLCSVEEAKAPQAQAVPGGPSSLDELPPAEGSSSTGSVEGHQHLPDDVARDAKAERVKLRASRFKALLDADKGILEDGGDSGIEQDSGHWCARLEGKVCLTGGELSPELAKELVDEAMILEGNGRIGERVQVDVLHGVPPADRVEPTAGLEPATYGLRNRCSTD